MVDGDGRRLGTSQRHERGLARYLEIYGDDAVVFPPGEEPFFDLMIDQLFAEVWTRPGLDVLQRRLLSIGVLAAQGEPEVIQLQFARALETGELTADQVREIVVHLVHYVGYGRAGGLQRAAAAAIAAVGGEGSGER